MNEFIQMVLKVYNNIPRIKKMGFLSSLFKAEFTNAYKVNLDVIRRDDRVAPVLRDYNTGAVVVSGDVFTGKEIVPATYMVETPTNLMDLMKRRPGETGFENRSQWLGDIVSRVRDSFTMHVDIIKRAIELQVSQVLQTGKLTLTGENGATDYELDFKPKATHFPTVTTAWGSSGEDPIGDLNSLADVIMQDGHTNVRYAIFGGNAWDNLSKNERFIEMQKARGVGLSELDPVELEQFKGAAYMGYLWLGAYKVKCFVYKDTYTDFASGSRSPFLNTNKVILLGDLPDLDLRLVYGGVPSLGMQPPFEGVIPPVVEIEGAFKAHCRVYEDTKKNTFTGETTARVVAVPASIDCFGCLKTTTV